MNPTISAQRSHPLELPSFKEFTAASQYEVSRSGPFPAVDRRPRSSLFTAGLVHLPPLEIPSRPLASSGSSRSGKRRYSEDDSRDSPDSKRYNDMRTRPSSDHSKHLSSPYADSPLMQDYPLSSTSSRPSSSRGLSFSSTQLSSNPTRIPPFGHRSTSTPPVSAPGPSNSAATLADPHSALAHDMNIAQIQPRYIFARTKPVHSSQTKKQPLSCFFCRKRKIACVRNDDAEGRTDAPCTQCTRRHLECRYPAISRRGQHARKDLLCGSDSPSGSPPADAAPDPDSP